MDRDTDLIPSSPSNSSLSSSDLDTESTGSFFQDRSTSLGTLMGISIRRSTSPPRRNIAVGGGGGRWRLAEAPGRPSGARRRRTRRGRSGWWRICRDETAVPTSLGDLLEVERRVIGADVLVVRDNFVYGGHANGGPRPLFQDGRVLPPPPPPAAAQRRRRGQQKDRLPVMITSMCSGDGWVV
ncbi:uncharacterized protein [Typha angustifolia]|uniref:uncharacterized protein n=1 Tax=Typha angustifolia TaxID=59011 RepID=UPI003C2B506A